MEDEIGRVTAGALVLLITALLVVLL